MNAMTPDFVRTALGRTLFFAAAFGATLIVCLLAGQVPDRSLVDWVALAWVLSLLSLSGGVLATSMEMQQG